MLALLFLALLLGLGFRLSPVWPRWNASKLLMNTAAPKTMMDDALRKQRGDGCCSTTPSIGLHRARKPGVSGRVLQWPN